MDVVFLAFIFRLSHGCAFSGILRQFLQEAGNGLEWGCSRLMQKMAQIHFLLKVEKPPEQQRRLELAGNFCPLYFLLESRGGFSREKLMNLSCGVPLALCWYEPTRLSQQPLPFCSSSSLICMTVIMWIRRYLITLSKWMDDLYWSSRHAK